MFNLESESLSIVARLGLFRLESIVAPADAVGPEPVPM